MSAHKKQADSLEAIQKIKFIEGVREALAQADRGEVMPIEEVRKLIKKWSVSSS